MQMHVRSLAATFVIATTSAVGLVGVSAIPAQAVSCPDNGWSILDGRIGRYFNGNGINIRTGPSTTCTSVGQGQASHTLQFDCWKSGENGTWSHVYNITTGREGWVKDSLLVDNGADVRC